MSLKYEPSSEPLHNLPLLPHHLFARRQRLVPFELRRGCSEMAGRLHPGVELRANLKSISHRCHLEEVAFVWELTKETIHLPLGRLQGGFRNGGATWRTRVCGRNNC